MFRKLLAGLTTLALALGMVALTAAPASAHHANITASFSCTSDNAGTITWTIHNTETGKYARIWDSNKSSVPEDTEFAPNETKTFTQAYSGTGSQTLEIEMRWYNGGPGGKSNPNNWGNSWEGSKKITINNGDYNACKPTGDDVTFCHWDSGHGGEWQKKTLPISAIIPDGHSGHSKDIIPQFPYKVNGVSKNFAGLNWNDQGQLVYNNGCTTDVPKPKAPTVNDAVCVAPNQSQGTVSIPSNVKGFTYSYRLGNTGGWTPINQGGTVQNVPYGTEVQVLATLITGYTVDSSWGPGWTKLTSTTGYYSVTVNKGKEPSKCITPAVPKLQPEVCNPAGTGVVGGYFIVYSTPGVKYDVSVNGGTTFSAFPAGDYGKQIPVLNGTTIVIKASPSPGSNVLVGGDLGPWTLYYAPAGDCRDEVVPVKPIPEQAQCTGPGTHLPPTYSVTYVEGVSYWISHDDGVTWDSLSAGPKQGVAGTSIKIEARPLNDDYKLAVGYDGPWTLVFDPAPCLVPVAPAIPDFDDAICEAETTGVTQTGYFIEETEHVSYTITVNSLDLGTALEGQFVPLNPGDEVLITAVPDDGYSLKAPSGPWPHKFANPGDDCLDDATPVEPEPEQSSCTGPGEFPQGKYVVTQKDGVSYWISYDGGLTWAPLAAGPHTETPGATILIEARALDGYKLVDSYDGPWTLVFDDPGDCLYEATVGDPVWTDSVCEPETTGATQGGYFIPTPSHVSYQVSVNGGDLEDAQIDTFVPTNPGDRVDIYATADKGYKLEGDDHWWHVFAVPGDCLDEAPVEAVTKVDQTCIVDDELQTAGKFGAVLRTASGTFVTGWITIPDTENVDYYIGKSATPATPGKHELPPGIYTVSAVAHDGYKLVGYEKPWVLEIEDAEACGDLTTDPSVVPLVTFVQTTCSVAGHYTLAVEPVENAAGIVWTVTGGLPTTLGTHSIKEPGKVTVTATAAPGYGIGDGQEGGVREFSFTFTGLPEDCLPTLALTGGNGIAAGALGLATLLTLGGVILVARSRREQLTAE